MNPPGDATAQTGTAAEPRRGGAGVRALLVLAVSMLLAGGAFDLVSLYVVSVALAILALGSFTWSWLATRGARVERLPGPATVVEDEPYPVAIRLRGGLVPPRGELADPLLDEPISVSPWGRGGIRVGARRSDILLDEQARLPRRGHHQLGPARMVVRDPLGICAREVVESTSGEVLVLPRVEPVLAGGARAGDGGPAGGSDDGAATGLGGPAELELDGLRPYRVGSPASRIHWPAVARHGELIERHLASGSEGTLTVVLDPERSAGEEAFDHAVRAAASLCVHLARAGGCALLLPESGRPVQIDPKLRAWPRAHARLALARDGGSVAGAARSSVRGTTFWVSAAEAPVLPRGLGRGSFLVTPFAPAAGRSTFTVAGCHGVPLSGRAGRGREARVAA